MVSISYCCHVLLLSIVVVKANEYYELLRLNRSASPEQIRTAAKSLLILYHPKAKTANKRNFLMVARAYEILKDEYLRTRYDIFGEEGLKEFQEMSAPYESLQFYKEEFGYYDFNHRIETLTQSDFGAAVERSNDIWFVNFYSPTSSESHELKPKWNEFANSMESIARIGVVNCADESHLCKSQGVSSYPSLVLYPGRYRYNGKRSVDHLIHFVLQNSPIKEYELRKDNFQMLKRHYQTPWIVTICGMQNECAGRGTVKQLALMMHGIFEVGYLNCLDSRELCSNLAGLHQGGTFLLEDGLVGLERSPRSKDYTNEIANQQRDREHFIDEYGPHGIADFALTRMAPEIPELECGELERIMNQDRSLRQNPPYLLRFIRFIPESAHIMDIAKLNGMLMRTSIKFAHVPCKFCQHMCDSFQVISYPSYVLLKSNGWESYYGKAHIHDVSNFAHSSVDNPLISLTKNTFVRRVIELGQPYLVQFFTPFCPLCMEMIVAMKSIARAFADRLSLAILDCSIHHELCRRYRIEHYPMVIFYNDSQPHYHHGIISSDSLKEFVEVALDSRVVLLNPDDFAEKLMNSSDTWVISFVTFRCGPCQNLEHIWRTVAKQLKGREKVHVGSMNCGLHGSFCQRMNIFAYPTIRFYYGFKKYVDYRSNYRDLIHLYQWVLDHLPSPVRRISRRFYADNIKNSPLVWVVNFYVQWCSQCFHLAPEFEELARRHSGLRFGKLNCEEFSEICREQQISYYPTLKVLPYDYHLDGLKVDSLDRSLQQIVKMKQEL